MEFFKRNTSFNKNESIKQESEEFPLEIYDFLKELEKSDSHPIYFALEGFSQLKNEAGNDEELSLFLLEDIIFSSLYTSFCESFFLEAQKSDLNLIENYIELFEKGSPEREAQIALEAESHLQYIINDGQCEGCSFCSSHSDLSPLVDKWNEGDIEYFAELYLGMQAIQSFFDQILYDYLPYNPNILTDFSMETIDKIRVFLIELTKKEISS
jgi:hypothetical protein